MLDMLQSADGALFRFVNHGLSNPFFDWLMPLASDTPHFGQLVVLVLLLLAWRGGARGRVCVLMLLLGLFLGDSVLSDALKHAVGRLRPFHHFDDARVLLGRSDSFSMPSSHAVNWFCATMITFIYYRRSVCFMLPLAVLVGFSRIYNGVHYPGDVLRAPPWARAAAPASSGSPTPFGNGPAAAGFRDGAPACPRCCGPISIRPRPKSARLPSLRMPNGFISAMR